MIVMSLISIGLLLIDMIYTLKKHSTKKFEKQREKKKEKERKKQEDIESHYKTAFANNWDQDKAYASINMHEIRPVADEYNTSTKLLD